MPSSFIGALIDQLADLDWKEVPRPQQVLAAPGTVPDPRKRRGVRHPIEGVPVIAVCAVATGARSFAGMAEWAADTAEGVLHEIGTSTLHAATIG